MRVDIAGDGARQFERQVCLRQNVAGNRVADDGALGGDDRMGQTQIAGDVVADVVERAPAADGDRHAQCLDGGDGVVHNLADGRTLVGVDDSAVQIEDDEIERMTSCS